MVVRDLDSIDRQNIEFDALTKLSRCWATLQQVAVVDDEYPKYRQQYEAALKDFLAALRTNKRL